MVRMKETERSLVTAEVCTMDKNSPVSLCNIVYLHVLLWAGDGIGGHWQHAYCVMKLQAIEIFDTGYTKWHIKRCISSFDSSNAIEYG